MTQHVDIYDINEKAAALRAGETIICDGYAGKNNVSYEITKNPDWKGEGDENNNRVIVVAKYGLEEIASIFVPEPVTDEHFGLNDIVRGCGLMTGHIGQRPSNVIEELRRMNEDLDLSHDDIFAEIVDDLDCCIEKGENDFSVSLNIMYEGYEELSVNSPEDAFSFMEARFDERIINDLQEEAEVYNISVNFDDSDIKAWADFFRQNDNYETFMEKPDVYDFIQSHRIELEMCDVVAYHLADVDMNKVYDRLNGSGKAYQINFVNDFTLNPVTSTQLSVGDTDSSEAFYKAIQDFNGSLPIIDGYIKPLNTGKDTDMTQCMITAKIHESGNIELQFETYKCGLAEYDGGFDRAKDCKIKTDIVPVEKAMGLADALSQGSGSFVYQQAASYIKEICDEPDKDKVRKTPEVERD